MEIQAIASDNHNFLLLFLDWHYPSSGILGDTYGMIIHSTGPPLDTLFLIPGSWGQERVGASCGNNYLVVFYTFLFSPEEHIFGQFISPTGVLIDTNFLVTPAIVVTDVIYEVSCDGNIQNYLVVWPHYKDSTDEYDIYRSGGM